MSLKLYNTESRMKEEVVAQHENTIRLYTCGPTVYNFAHIGNFRTYVFEDLLRRTLKFFGFNVLQVMNLTDVDDKTIKGAIENKISLDAFTDQYKKAFFEDLKVLNIESAEVYPAATDYIPQMIEIIQKLLDEKIAYQGNDGCIYFSIERFPSYGRLSHLQLDELQVAASQRVAADEYEKESVSDFCLWKAYDPERDGNIYWESPFGKGRPGWHIECSAMAMALLGESIDIHCGGVDNMFPHHENEIAQSECYSKKRFVRYWLHSEHLLVDGKKMSKSKGNFYLLRDLLKMGYSGPQIRLLLLQTHYRTQLNFTLQGLESSKHALSRLSEFVHRLHDIQGEKSFGLAAPLLKKSKELFSEHLADDLNISPALAALFDLVRDINALCDEQKISRSEANDVLELLSRFDQVLGVLPLKIEKVALSPDLLDLLEKRQKARAEKKWSEADHFRDAILARGYVIEDTPTGARLKQKES
jgi:cysteinyl-tRNA synthetase